MIESITFNIAENKITVTYADGTSKDYTDREADCDAMGWDVSDTFS